MPSLTTALYLEPLTQIVGGVGLLLSGVLNLVGNLLSGLGLDGLLKGIVSATVCSLQNSIPNSMNHEFPFLIGLEFYRARFGNGKVDGISNCNSVTHWRTNNITCTTTISYLNLFQLIWFTLTVTPQTRAPTPGSIYLDMRREKNFY